MRILEIIRLRSIDRPLAGLSEHIEITLSVALSGEQAVTLYRRAGLETDLAIHIVRRESDEAVKFSALGLRLAAELRELGLVEHTLWEALD